MLTCYDVADYLLSQANEEVGDLVSNLKLQKLVYYAQGLHLALYEEPLFPEAMEAWTHGPVVPDLYRRYKEFASGAIPRPEGLDFTKFTPEVRELLDEVYAVYGQFSAWKLREMTHNERPWQEANAAIVRTITHESLQDYFKTQLVAD